MQTAERAVAKYLAVHAEPEAKLSEALASRRFADVLVVPAAGEHDDLFRLLGSVPRSTGGEVLVIVVVNAREGDDDTTHASNRSVLDELSRRFDREATLADGTTLRAAPFGAIVAIDRASPGRRLPARQGVGLARKVGSDLALALGARDAVASRWIHCSDADAVLPPDYFERAPGVSECAALVHPFRHVHFGQSAHSPASRVALEYEISLRYGVLGLLHAGSPYAFHTIGSTIVIDAACYAAARGFPRREAAEDFHLLSKLRKLGPVQPLRGAPVLLSDRASTRVPFGTGAAIVKASGSNEPRTLFDPGSFDLLRAWLRLLDRVADPSGRASASDVFDRELDAELRAALEVNGEIARAVRSTATAHRPEILRRRLHEGFDALATLRLLHALRDGGRSVLPLRDALRAAPFTAVRGTEPLEEIREILAAEELQRVAPVP